VRLTSCRPTGHSTEASPGWGDGRVRRTLRSAGNASWIISASRRNGLVAQEPHTNAWRLASVHQSRPGASGVRLVRLAAFSP